MISFNCPQCQAKLTVKDEAAGKKGRCPQCQAAVLVPGVSTGVANEQTLAPSAVNIQEGRTIPPPARVEKTSPTLTSGVRSSPNVSRALGGLASAAALGGVEDREAYDFLAPPEQPDEIGRLGQFRILKVLGKGGMGVVFLAEDTVLKRQVALKAMLPALAASESNCKRFIREAQAAAALEHEHIIQIYTVGEDRGVPFVAMPLLKGEALDERLRRESRLPIAEILRIGREVAEGLAAAHDKGLIHRDIKPANVFLNAPSPNQKPKVKILDFGLARATDEAHLTQTGAILGTPAFMAPEQTRGEKVDQRADLFSLGAVLFRMCTGDNPFQGADTIATLVSVATRKHPPVKKLNPQVPDDLAKLIDRLLAKEKDERPKSAHEVVEALRAIEEKRPAPASSEFAFDEPAAVVAAPKSKRAKDDEDDHTMPESPRKDKQEKAAGLNKKLLAMIGGGAAAALLLIVVLSGGREEPKKVAENKASEPKGIVDTKKAGSDKDEKNDVVPVAGADPDREVAQWVLNQPGGLVSLTVGNKQLTVFSNKNQALPAEPFQVRSFSLSTKRPPFAGQDFRGIKNLSSLEAVFLSYCVAPDVLPILAQCPTLRNVQLPTNDLKANDLELLAQSPRLMSLDVTGNPVDDSIADLLPKLTNLTMLIAGSTEVTSKFILALKPPLRLQSLTLNKTKVDDGAMAALATWPALRQLYLTDTPVSDLGLKELARSQSLTTLTLRGSKVTDAGVKKLLSDNPRIRVVDWKDPGPLAKPPVKKGVAVNPPAGGDPDRVVAEWALTKLPANTTVEVTLHLKADPEKQFKLNNREPVPAEPFFVTDVRLSGGPLQVRDSDFHPFAELSQLRYLQIERVKILSALPFLAKMKTLSHLGIIDCDVGTAHLEGIADCTGLTQLYLLKTRIDDDFLARVVPRLKNLVVINASGTQVTAAGVQELQQRLPNCKIIR